MYCNKWQEMTAFYRDGLKLEVAVSLDWFVEFRLNETACLSVADARRASVGSSEGKGLTVTLKVDDIRTVHRQIKETGLEPTPIKDHPWGAKVFYLRDPEGNRIEFWTDAGSMSCME